MMGVLHEDWCPANPNQQHGESQKAAGVVCSCSARYVEAERARITALLQPFGEDTTARRVLQAVQDQTISTRKALAVLRGLVNGERVEFAEGNPNLRTQEPTTDGWLLKAGWSGVRWRLVAVSVITFIALLLGAHFLGVLP